MTTLAQRERPGVVTFVVVLLWIQAITTAVAGVVALSFRGNASVQETVNQTSSELLTYAIIEIVVALIIALVAVALASRGRGARLLVAIVQVIRVGTATWAIATHHAGGYMAASIVTIALGVFILWALYGNDRSEAFFAKA